MKRKTFPDVEIVGSSQVTTLSGETVTVVVYSDGSSAVVYE
jgi:hypothetical protein